MRAILGTALAVALIVSATYAGDDAKKDLEKVQGAWVVTLMEEMGKKAPNEVIKGLGAQIKGDRLTLSEQGKVIMDFEIKLDPAQKPKAVDFTYLAGEDKGKKELGIYEIEGDTLKLCVNDGGKDRPKEFKTAADNTLNLVILKRKK
ncbi:MAG: TIGR03067 domain-containing protein [Gemmataceae bacterium]|nr:TIGR03067 domain-containing protein [Gemmataceae bacterium]